MKHLIVERGVDPGATDIDGFTALYYAARVNNCVEAVAALVFSYNQDPGARSNEGWTPVHQAADSGNLKILKYLVETRGTGIYGWTTVHLAAIAKYFVKTRGVKSNNGWTPVHLASQNGHLETLKYLVETRGHACEKRDFPCFWRVFN
eukprot:TRINITY_DN3785_c2_g1_i5.p1 TRINITY_DN3785_c2_g1~~TRINITY_DN3785_c2_g1_i5.p1  ORF type:complete len:148 (-),score=1.07 TRINITY_DN3785_c2_g1_i5:181-624(-)